MQQISTSFESEGNLFQYATFDNPTLKLAGVEAVLSIYGSLYPLQGTRYLFLDEIQYTENWDLWMKVLYEAAGKYWCPAA